MIGNRQSPRFNKIENRRSSRLQSLNSGKKHTATPSPAKKSLSRNPNSTKRRKLVFSPLAAAASPTPTAIIDPLEPTIESADVLFQPLENSPSPTVHPPPSPTYSLNFSDDDPVLISLKRSKRSKVNDEETSKPKRTRTVPASTKPLVDSSFDSGDDSDDPDYSETPISESMDLESLDSEEKESENEVGESDGYDSPFEVTDSTLRFYAPMIVSREKALARMVILGERRIDSDDFKRFNLVEYLASRSLLQSASLVSGFCSAVIKDFYGNVHQNLMNSRSSKHGRIYVRGRVYELTPAIVNSILGFTVNIGDDADDYDLSKSNVVKHITGNQVSVWDGQLPAACLTSKFSIIHKIMAFNWLPSSSKSVVTEEQGKLLYKIDKNIPFDLGRIILANIMAYSSKFTDKGRLPYPSLIYNILKKQGFKRKRSEVIDHEIEYVRVSPKLLISNGKRLVDLPLSGGTNDQAAQGHDGSADVRQKIQVLDKELRELRARMAAAERLREELNASISSPKGGGNASGDTSA